jgi:hypothetical protein
MPAPTTATLQFLSLSSPSCRRRGGTGGCSKEMSVCWIGQLIAVLIVHIAGLEKGGGAKLQDGRGGRADAVGGRAGSKGWRLEV